MTDDTQATRRTGKDLRTAYQRARTASQDGGMNPAQRMIAELRAAGWDDDRIRAHAREVMRQLAGVLDTLGGEDDDERE